MAGSRPTLAVVGATGAVGTATLRVLSMREDVWGEIRLAASRRSAGRRLRVRDQELSVAPLGERVLEGVDVAILTVPADVAAHWAPVAAASGAVVVDASAAFRADPDVPLVVPQVNPHAARQRPRGIVSNPGSTTLTMMDAVGALHARWGLTELVVASYQAASGAGQGGLERLYDEGEVVAGDRSLGTVPGDVRRTVEDKLADSRSPFPAPLALNVVPWSGSVGDAGWTSEELALRDETRKVLGVPDLKVSATCVRVPVVTAHSVAVHATFTTEVDVEEARRVLVQAPTVVVLDDPERGVFPTPVDVVGTDPIFAGRIRQAPDLPSSLELFLCADNLRKGGALNAVQVAELVARDLTD